MRVGSMRRVLFVLLFMVTVVGTMKPLLARDRRTAARPATAERVYLVHADRLRYNHMVNAEANILNGNVVFRHLNVHMYCDSAYFYKETNSFEAFGHVRMVQGDTLSLTGEYLYYDGNAQIAQVRRNVKLTHRQSVLLTDSLNYDRLYNVGYFFEGGKLNDGQNELTSDWGEYFPETREATFNYNVKLVNKQFTLTSDTLHYNTATKLAHMVGPSNVVSKDNRMYTENGYYNTQTENSRLFGRSTVVNNGKTMTGDTLFYDKEKGLMQGFGHVVYVDKENKNLLLGEEVYYDENKGYALTTGRALAKDFSNVADTLFMHADTFKLFTFYPQTDSVYRIVRGYYHARMFRSDVQAVCDSLQFNSREHVLSMYGNPIVWSDNQQLLGEEIHAYFNDSTIDSAHVVRQCLLVQQVDSVHFDQIASRRMMTYFKDKAMDWSKAVGNVETVYYPFDDDSLMIGLNRMETTEMHLFMKDKKMNRIWASASQGTLYPLALAPDAMHSLDNFAWFDYIRPRDKNDLFEWRAKRVGTELKASQRHQIPLQTLGEVVNKRLSKEAKP